MRFWQAAMVKTHAIAAPRACTRFGTSVVTDTRNIVLSCSIFISLVSTPIPATSFSCQASGRRWAGVWGHGLHSNRNAYRHAMNRRL